MAQRKSKERLEEPLETLSYQTSSKRSPPFWLLICPQGLFWPFFTFLLCHIFPPVQTFPRPHYLSLGPRGCKIRKATCKRTQQLPTMLGLMVHRRMDQPIKSCTLVKWRGRAVQTDSTLLCYASAITKQNKCLAALLAPKFDRFETLCNDSQQHATKCDGMCKRA